MLVENGSATQRNDIRHTQKYEYSRTLFVAFQKWKKPTNHYQRNISKEEFGNGGSLSSYSRIEETDEQSDFIDDDSDDEDGFGGARKRVKARSHRRIILKVIFNLPAIIVTAAVLGEEEARLDSVAGRKES